MVSGSGLPSLPFIQAGSASKVQDLEKNRQGSEIGSGGHLQLATLVELASGSDLLKLPSDSEDEVVLFFIIVQDSLTATYVLCPEGSHDC